MTSYMAVLSARFRAQLQYRGAALAGCGTQLFWGLIRVMIFQAFYALTTHRQPMHLRDTITYIWLGQCFLTLVPFQPDGDVRQMIKTGAVAYEMVRPVDLYAYWYCRAIADRVAPAILRSIPIYIVASLFFGLRTPPNWQCALAWTAATTGAVLISIAVTTLMTISLLWTTSGEGIARLAPPLVWFLSGMTVPLVFIPHRLQLLFTALPFRYIVDVPFRIYMGHLPQSTWASIALYESFWIVVLIAFGRWCLQRGMGRLVVQGG